MLQLFFFYFTFAPAKEPKDLNLIIDIGNTKAKIAFFDGGEIVDVVAESNQSLGCLKALCSQYPVEQGIVATVIDLNEKVLAEYKELETSYTNLKTATTISLNGSDVKETKLRLSKLVREVDKCIALLNE